MSNALTIIAGDIDGARDAFNAALVDRSIRFEAEAGFALQALQASEYTLKVALDNRQSVVDAVTNVAAIGLSLNPAKKQAYRLPCKSGGATKIVLAISYPGLIELATASGSIRWAQAAVVREKDAFAYNGMGKEPTHSFNAFAKDRGAIVGVYCVAKTVDGDHLTEMMSTDEVNAIRDRGEAWKSFKAGKAKSCPWETDWSEMAKKTIVIRASKYWPKTDRLDQATHYLNTEGGEGLAELAPGVRAPKVSGFDPQAWITKATATKTEPELTKVYGEAMAAAAAAQDREGAAKFKEVALAHRAKLREANTVDA